MSVRLYQGDCLDVLKTLDAGSVDAVVTDPPCSSGGQFRSDRCNRTTDKKYTVHAHQGRHADFSGDNMDQRAWSSWCREWLSEARRVTRQAGYLVCFTDWRQLPTLSDVVQWSGWTWRGVLVWDKTEGAKGPHTGYFAHQCEHLVWTTNGPCEPKPTLAQGGEGRMPGCFRQSSTASGKFHQTGKPVNVMEWLVRCVRLGETVLDPFMGGGTTGVACVNTGRHFVGVESVPHYFGVSRRRIYEAQVRVAARAPATLSPPA